VNVSFDTTIRLLASALKKSNAINRVDKEVPYSTCPTAATVAIEADGATTVQFSEGPRAPRKVVADLVLRCDTADRLIDVTICDPSAKSYISSFSSNCNPGAAVEARATTKFASYVHRIPDIVSEENYTTFAMEVTGRLSGEAQDLLTTYVGSSGVKQGMMIRNQLTRLMWKWNAKKILYGRKLMGAVEQPNKIIINQNLHDRI
jgi:hypothetical protein